MPLSSDLVSQFAKVTDDSKVVHKENRLRGTIVADGGALCVQLDGSEVKTPIAKVDSVTGELITKDSNNKTINDGTTTSLSEGDRVEVEIKNHTAVVTGNLTNPSLGIKEAGDMRTAISQTEKEIKLLAEKDDKLEASISVTAEEIREEVKDVREGLEASIKVNADQIVFLVEKDGEFTKVIQKFDGVEFVDEDGVTKISGGSISTKDLNLSGAITFGDIGGTLSHDQLDENTKSQISSAQSTADSASSKADEAQADADKAWEQATAAGQEAYQAKVAADSAVGVFEGFLTEGYDDSGLVLGTYIDGKRIAANTIYANKLHLGGLLTVYDSIKSTSIGGYLGYNSGYSSRTGIGIWNTLTGPQVVCSNEAARLSYGEYSSFVATTTQANIDGVQYVIFEIGGNARVALYDSNLSPATTAVYLSLGTASYPWSAVYASTGSVSTSDRNQKNSIEDLPEKYVAMFDQLQPKRFKLNSGTSDRYHVGYIAQEVEEAMASVGIDSQEFGGLVKDKDENGNDVYLLRYSEFDAIRDAKIKQLETENNDLKARVETLEKLVTQFLEER